MYMAYGWPQVLSLERGPCSQKIIFLKVINRLLLIVTSSHLEIWSSSQHKVRLGKYMRDKESLEKEGDNLQVAWNPDAKLIAVITSSFYLHIFNVKFSEKRLQIGGKQVDELFLVNISLLLNEKVPLPKSDLKVSNVVCDKKNMLLGLSNGSLYSISWKGEFFGDFELDHSTCDGNEVSVFQHSACNGVALGATSGTCTHSHTISRKSLILNLELCLPLRLLLVLYANGQLLSCSIAKRGVKQADSIKVETRVGPGDATCTSVGLDQKILAVGTGRGVVELYDLAKSASLIRTVSLYEWGYSMDDTGSVSCIAWTPGASAFAVGWKLRGLAVWSVSGCCLMSTIRQVALKSTSSIMNKQHRDFQQEPLMSGTSLVQWDEYGYRLYVAEEGSSDQLVAFSFGKCCLARKVSGMTFDHQVIYGEDRLLVVHSEDADELKMLHLKLPVSYLSQNWPIQHVAATKDGTYFAVAGLRGLILYDIHFKRWRVFGDVTQEQKIQCKGLSWMGKIIVVCNYNASSNTYELLFYPRYHLDETSLLCRKPLIAKPMVIDVYLDYILVAYFPFDINILHSRLYGGELTPSSTPKLQYVSSQSSP